MAKLDYKKLWEQQKKDNILMRTENEKLNLRLNEANFRASKFEAKFEDALEGNKSWEYLRNVKQGEAEGIMRCFKELLNNKNQQKDA